MADPAPPISNGVLRGHAAAFVAAGLCALPAVRTAENKRVALPAWKDYQSRLPSKAELTGWFKASTHADPRHMWPEGHEEYEEPEGS